MEKIQLKNRMIPNHVYGRLLYNPDKKKVYYTGKPWEAANKQARRKQLWGWILTHTLFSHLFFSAMIFVVTYGFSSAIKKISSHYLVALPWYINTGFILLIILAGLLFIFSLLAIPMTCFMRYSYLAATQKQTQQEYTEDLAMIKSAIENDDMQARSEAYRLARKYDSFREISYYANCDELRSERTNVLYQLLVKQVVNQGTEIDIDNYLPDSMDIPLLMRTIIECGKINPDSLTLGSFQYVFSKLSSFDIGLSDYEKAQFIYFGLRFQKVFEEVNNISLMNNLKGYAETNNLEFYQKELVKVLQVKEVSL